MIVGKALKNNKELIDNKNKEIEFSIKYQILSNDTALFAEIINDFNDINQNKLIIVNLNDYIQEKIFNLPASAVIGGGNVNINLSSIPLLTNPFQPSEAYIFYRSQKIGGVPRTYIDNCLYNNLDKLDFKFEKRDITKLIISQNIIEGYWDENEETKELLNIIDKDKINIIISKIKSLNKRKENENKIKYTILVIYYLNTDYFDKINEYILIINKAKKYLLNQGVKYEEIIEGIQN